MEEIYVDAISTRALPSGSFIRNLHVSRLLFRYYGPLSLMNIYSAALFYHIRKD